MIYLKNAFLIICALLVLSSNQCKEKEKQNTSQQMDLNTEQQDSFLYKKWFHSYEEDKDGIKTFRPEGYNFPPSRGREGFAFKKNGEFVRLGPGANDAPEENKGKWSKKDKTVKISFNDKQRAGYTIEIISVSKDKLQVKETL